MGIFKTKEEKDKRKKEKVLMQDRNESRRKALHEQNKKNMEIRNLYQERSREERRLRERAKPRN